LVSLTKVRRGLLHRSGETDLVIHLDREYDVRVPGDVDVLFKSLCSDILVILHSWNPSPKKE
jgi:hypothetical protein